MVLEDHIKKGKKLIPSILASSVPIRLTRWDMDRLPELFWIGFISERVGYPETAAAVEEFSAAVQSAIQNVRANKDVVRAYRASEHCSFTESERKSIASSTKDQPWRKLMAPHFYDLGRILPTFPMRYLATSTSKKKNRGSLISELKGLIGKCDHRHDKIALYVQATALIAEIRIGNTSMARGLPNLNSLSQYPDTEESQNAAGHVVASCSSLLMGLGDSDMQWQREFWNSCYRLERCEYGR